MRIALFTENYYVGGLDTYIITLINNWPNEDDQFILICNKSHPGINRYENEIKRDVEFIWHNHFHKNFFNKFILNFFNSVFLLKVVRRILSNMSCLFLINYLFFLKKTLLKSEPDRLIVVNGGYPGGLLCRAATICWGLYSNKESSIHNFHNIAISTSKFNIYQNLIDKFVEKYSKSLISVSNCSAESIRTRKSFQKTKKLSFIYNGIGDKNDCQYEDFRDILNIDKVSNICLMLGTYEERKGHKFILKVFKEVLKKNKNTYLIVCGFGSVLEKKAVKDYAMEIKVDKNVLFLNFVNGINNLFAITDILLIGSQEFESFGLTAVEAMLNRVPVVSTNTGGLKEVVENNNGGFVFDKNDYIGFSNKVIELLNNKKMGIEQGNKGHKRVKEKFSASRMSEMYYKAIQ